MGGCRLDSAGSEWGTMASSCEHNYERIDFTRGKRPPPSELLSPSHEGL